MAAQNNSHLKLAHSGPGNASVAPPGEPPYDGGMETRVAKLEDFAVETRDRLVRIETRMDTLATKEELHKELHSLTWKVLGGMGAICAALVSVTYLIAKYVH